MRVQDEIGELVKRVKEALRKVEREREGREEKRKKRVAR